MYTRVRVPQSGTLRKKMLISSTIESSPRKKIVKISFCSFLYLLSILIDYKQIFLSNNHFCSLKITSFNTAIELKSVT